MKKSKYIKSALIFSGLIGVTAAINRVIFKRAEKKSRTGIRETYYKWHHGNIHYTVTGSGRPLLLLHSMAPGSGLHEWDRVVSTLSRRYTVYVPDMPGFGYSCKAVTAYSSYLYISFINDFIQNVIGEKTLVAASGTSGAFLVTAYTFNPELYRKILLVSPKLNAGLASKKCALAGRLIELPVLGTALYNIITSKIGIGLRLKKLLPIDGKNFSEIVNRYYYAAHFNGANAKYPLAAYLYGFLSPDANDKLKQIMVPVHVLKEGDIPNAFGSYPHILAPKAFYKICRSFYK